LRATLVGPTQDEEQRLWNHGYLRVAGVDEVGRGSLAGPVVAAAVVLPDLTGVHLPDLALVRDSKVLTPRQRERAADVVRSIAVGFGLGEVSSVGVDRMGIAPATRLAMCRALDRIPQAPDHLLVDALTLAWDNLPCTAVIRGDGLCTAIAAASVLAKVYRDALMRKLDAEYVGYGFAMHKGYGTRMHLSALVELGPSPIHRRTFSPMRVGSPLRQHLASYHPERYA
jgi:ribonuclease HII